MFGVHAIWTAAQHEVPVIFVVVNNGHYGILKAFAAFQRTPGVPGLDLPGLDIPLIARGLGADACRISSAIGLAESFQDALRTAAERSGPVLLDVVVDPEVPALFGEPVS
jgi:benzoylformate decarboxylase